MREVDDGKLKSQSLRFGINSASCKYRNKLAKREVQFVPMGFPTDCCETWSSKTTCCLIEKILTEIQMRLY